MSEYVEQVGEAEVKRLYAAKQYDKINKLRESGALAELMGQPIPIKIDEGEGAEQWDQATLHEQFKLKNYSGIEKAKNAGLLNDLLGITE